MPRRAGRRGPRGLSLIELMIAMVLLIVSVLGLVAGLREAMNANATAHRRTGTTLLRTGLVERLSVTRRSTIDGFAGAGWLSESCYDENGVATATNTTYTVDFACPAGTTYVRHVSATAVPTATGADQRLWQVAVYVDQQNRPAASMAECLTSTTCVAANLLLTD